MPREVDPNVETAIEGMNAQQFVSYLASRSAALASLSVNVAHYPAKRLLLEMAIETEKAVAERVRTISTLTVHVGAVEPNLTAARRTALLVTLRQDLFNSRKMFLFAKILASDGFDAAYEVLGGASVDDLLSPDEKKKLEDARKKNRRLDDGQSGDVAAILQSLVQSTVGGNKRENSNLLSMLAAGAKPPKFKRDKQNSPCFDCK